MYLDEDKEVKTLEERKYWGMIGSFLYFTPPHYDIMFFVCLCACFQVNPKEPHLTVVKCIMSHLNSTQLMGLWFSKGAYFTLFEYSDSDFIDCKLDKKVSEMHVTYSRTHLSLGISRNKQVACYP